MNSKTLKSFIPSTSKLLHSSLLFSVISVLTFFTIIGYIFTGQLDNIMLFGLIALLVSFATKNKIVLMGIPLILVSIRNMNRREGMQNEEDDDDKTLTPEQKEKKKEIKKAKAKAMQSEKGLSSADSSDTKTRPSIDYAATVAEAYGNLNGMLGEKGIQQLTNDTKTLMDQQLQLAKSMEAMTPLIEGIMPMAEKAQKMIEQMESSTGMNGSLASITEMAKKLTRGAQ